MAASPGKSSLCKRWREPGYRTRLMPTLYLLVAYIALGFITAQRGSAFLDIQLITHTTLETASFFFTASAVGGVVGALVFGGLYDKFNRNLLLYLTVLGMSATVVIIPYCTAYEAMLVAWFCNTFFMGGFDASASAEVVRMWGLESQPYLFLVNLGFSIGAFLAPLLTEPFLVPKDLVESVLNYTQVDCSGAVVNMSTSNYSRKELFGEENFYESDRSFSLNSSICNDSTKPPDFNIRLHHAYTISAVLALVASLPLLFQTCRNRQSTTIEKSSTEYEEVRELPMRHYIVALIIIISTFVFNSTIEDAYASFLMTFVVKQLNWSKTQGAQLSSVYFGMYVIVRAVGFFCADVLSPTLLLLSSLLALVLTIAGITLSSIYSALIGVWIFTGICGFLIGILFPVAIAWINKTIVSVSGKISSFMLLGSAVGKFCNPIVLGFFMEEFSPLWFCYISLIEAGLSVAIVVMASIYGQEILAKVRRRNMEIVVTVDEKIMDELSLNGDPTTA
ncbi:hypothetical protein SNE40_022582 [Patella caerulea]|uniref:Sodium-dependent glucose transporter 1 n=1 Tax=Patella caerulea TaxID=87958 RepID=A0AAN8GG93_PATCE